MALILFAGGDGTARDILAVVGDACRSSAFPAASRCNPPSSPSAPRRPASLPPSSSGRRRKIAWREAEVMDMDEDASATAGFRRGSMATPGCPSSAAWFRTPRPASSPRMRRSTARGEIAAELEPERSISRARGTHQAGPASSGSRRHVARRRCGSGRQAAGRDLTARSPMTARPAGESSSASSVARAIIFGRGNQQIGPSIIRAVGRDNIVILASQAKILALAGIVCSPIPAIPR